MGGYRNRIAGNHHFGKLSIMVRMCKRTTRTTIFVVHSFLLPYTTTALSSSQCDPASIAQLRLAGASQNSIDHAANNANCRAYFKEFVEAVTARHRRGGRRSPSGD